MKRVFFILFMVSGLFGCNSDEPAMVRINDWFTLGMGEKVKIIDDKNHVLFLSLGEIEENRCPSDVICIQPGNVLVKVVIEDTRNSQYSTLLCLGDCSPSITNMKSFVFYNIEYTIDLKEVNPFPTTKNRDVERSAIMKIFRN
jgi:hypothetical protein